MTVQHLSYEETLAPTSALPAVIAFVVTTFIPYSRWVASLEKGLPAR